MRTAHLAGSGEEGSPVAPMLVLATVGLAVNFRPGALISPLGPMFRDSGSLGDLSELRGEAPLGFQLHSLFAFALIFRSRDDEDLGSHSPRRGWDRVG